MNNKKKLSLIIFLVLIVFIPIGASKFFYREHGTFSDLKMSKYYINKTFSVIFVTRSAPDKNQTNPQTIENSGRSLKIFNYLDEFKLTEYKNENGLRRDISKEYNGIYRLSFAADDGTIFTITINDEKHIVLYVGDPKSSSIRRYYKIDNGNISSEKLEELLK